MYLLAAELVNPNGFNFSALLDNLIAISIVIGVVIRVFMTLRKTLDKIDSKTNELTVNSSSSIKDDVNKISNVLVNHIKIHKFEHEDLISSINDIKGGQGKTKNSLDEIVGEQSRVRQELQDRKPHGT